MNILSETLQSGNRQLAIIEAAETIRHATPLQYLWRNAHSAYYFSDYLYLLDGVICLHAQQSTRLNKDWPHKTHPENLKGVWLNPIWKLGLFAQERDDFDYLQQELRRRPDDSIRCYYTSRDLFITANPTFLEMAQEIAAKTYESPIGYNPPVDKKERIKPIRVAKVEQEESRQFIYGITDGRYIKIGMTRSSCPKSRLGYYGTASPVPLSVVGVFLVQDARQSETTLHTLFSSRRVRNEWFDVTENEFTTEAEKLGTKYAA
jgi:hypothetical protein